MPRLEKYIKQIRGISYSPNDISDVPVMDYLPILKANNIQDGSLKTDSLIFIHKSKIKPEQLIKKGDILIAASSGSKDIVGKSVFFDEDFDGGFGAFCKVIRPVSTIYPKFVSAFFKTPEYKRHIKKVIQGANINNLRTEDIDSLIIPLFPLTDQIKIAQILTQAEKLIARRNESIAQLDEYLKSTFSDYFDNPVTNRRNYRNARLKEFITFLTSGGRGWGEYYATSGERFIRSLDVQMNYISNKDVAYVTPPNNQEANRTKVQPYDILLTITGSKIGRVAMVPIDFGTAYVSQHVAIIRTKDINPNYLSFYLSEINCGQYLINKSFYGQTKPGLNFKQIENFEIVVPPIELQTQFAQIVEKTEALKSWYQHSLRELEQLFGSLSQRAFKGELDLSRMEVSEEAYNISDTPPSPTPLKPEKVKKERPQVAVKADSEASIWLSNRKKGKMGKVLFTNVEGNAVLAEFSIQDKGFHFQAFEAFLKKEGFVYEYEQVKDFLFEKLEQQELLQYYSNVEWMEERYRQEIGSDEDDFLGDGQIWLIVNTNGTP